MRARGPPFYGKYRGKVKQNLDPFSQGRLQIECPDVLGSGQMSWALPCVPYAGAGVGLFLIPPVGANVWVEFEGGDPDKPIWSGCFWGVGEWLEPPLADFKVLKTAGITLRLIDLPGAGGIQLEVGPPQVSAPMSLKFDATGIELRNAAFSVKLGPAGVSINDGALEVI